ncbi:MAG: GDP-mannose 4,6-dehydratase [Pirellulaceae bacterium]|nr:GDP-mannose 4,6-dehydratase [Pirellulaceae bacterium]
MKKMVIVGSEGQDGSMLFDRCSQYGNDVVGLGHSSMRIHSHDNRSLDSIKECGSTVDVMDSSSVDRLVGNYQPDEIYYLAAFHQSADAASLESRMLLDQSFATHVTGFLNCLEAIRIHSKETRIFYAASSHVFGDPTTPTLSERSPINPTCIYGITKAAATHLGRFYRRNHRLFVSIGFLFNHESPRRRPDFLSQRIVRAAISIKQGTQNSLVLGDLSATVDWGDAGDTIDAMTRILELDEADDFVVATGIPHSVKDFVAVAFRAVGLDWETYVSEDRNIVLKKRAPLIGDATKLYDKTKWRPTVSFEEMVSELVYCEAIRQKLDLGRDC